VNASLTSQEAASGHCGPWRRDPARRGTPAPLLSALTSRDVWLETTTPNHTVLHWNGTHWLSTGRLWGLTRDCCPITGIAPLSDRDVWAAGTCCDVSHLYYGVYIAHWDGKRWQRVTAPFQDGSFQAEIDDIAAVSTDNLWAVGQRGNSPLVEHYTCSR
jgi:hypothetical protein